MNPAFAQEESRCEYLFYKLGPCWHLCTPENNPLILTDEEDFRAAMTIIAICALAFPGIKVLTFELMSNHIHVALAGTEEDMDKFFSMFKVFLGYYLKSKGRSSCLEGWSYKALSIDNIRYMRNTIAYINRNGFIVNKDHSPYSYPWGANKYFFNPDAIKRAAENSGTLNSRVLRSLFHTHKLDAFSGLPYLDGIVPPPVFCDIRTAEGLFRNASHYFSIVSRNIEGMKGIAGIIGESIYYTDEDLYSVARKIATEQYRVDKPHLIPAQGKLDVARILCYEYNAGAKQVARLLKLDLSLVKSLLPSNH